MAETSCSLANNVVLIILFGSFIHLDFQCHEELFFLHIILTFQGE